MSVRGETLTASCSTSAALATVLQVFYDVRTDSLTGLGQFHLKLEGKIIETAVRTVNINSYLRKVASQFLGENRYQEIVHKNEQRVQLKLPRLIEEIRQHVTFRFQLIRPVCVVLLQFNGKSFVAIKV